MVKTGPLRIAKTGILLDWQIWSPPDWQSWDPSELGKLGPFRIGKNWTLPDWDLSGFVKIDFQIISKFSPDILPDAFSDAIMLFELTGKSVFSFPRSFRIEAKP